MLFSCTGLTSISFPKLTTVSGSTGSSYILRECSNLEKVYFPKLTTVTGNGAFLGAFFRCTALTDIYFNSLKTSSFGSSIVNQFNSMMSGTGTSVVHTLHFPSNLQSTISGLTSYPNFGGTSGYVTLAFDLPATS